MAAMSAAMAASGSAVAGPLSSPFSTSGFNSARVQQLGIKRTNTSLSASRIVVVRASHNSGVRIFPFLLDLIVCSCMGCSRIDSEELEELS